MVREVFRVLVPVVVLASGCNINIEPPGEGPEATSSTSGVGGSGGGGVGGGGGSAGEGGSGGGVGGSGAGGSGTGGAGGGSAESRCTVSPQEVACPYETQSIPAQSGILRDVAWQVPLGTPPAKGFPVVLLFQGSFYGPSMMFKGAVDGPHGVYHLALTIKGLLDAGYAVLAPEAHAEGTTFWDTNVPPYSIAWSTAPDHDFMLSIFDSIAAGSFGPLDASRLYATGISSGGYMTSRMAVSYQGKFRALAIHSGSYATCSGPVCILPDALPADHPPTLFLHGEADLVVPISTMEKYNARLVTEGKETRVVTAPGVGHDWLAAGPEEVVAWFDAHP
ncbi:prolyl oligopeptidase family serine peptidase [Polyangium sp. y55x31]|uniref:extracellular medium-chain-length polyhydroxyalkanoate depolymerase n=1 Tax=Polyangium sp. y55x31 TaxID=3042688 RepID=UPI002482DB85|nr:prolyl oligopeptidase family serine peptidase [Polyangium sp. y55x31]MDI1478836.1 prolyl oligopeptidase family serine peptidase [Polyangium sp. y55x31]